MATQAQLDANRRNSQKSTGPRTDAGKSASSRNATRSGLYANTLLIDGDDPDELDALAREYLDTCRPVGPRERAVVDSLIHTDWLLRRMRRLETQDWNSEFEHLRKLKGDEYNETYGLINVYARIQDRLDRIQRRLTTLDRLYHRRLAELERLQSNRPPAPDPEPIPVPAPEIGFVPSNPGPSREAPPPPSREAADPSRSDAPAPGPWPLAPSSAPFSAPPNV
jgi:hypothetical protein